MESEQSPQVKGFVIITLPPADNPSLGKTITAFTLSDSASPPPLQQNPQLHRQSEYPIPIQSPQPIRGIRFPFRKFFFNLPRVLLGIVGVSLLVCILWNSLFSDTLVELTSIESEKNEPNSFLLPLYPKINLNLSNINFELKLGRFVGGDKNGGWRSKKSNKLVSLTSSAASAANIPVRGNVYPYGLYFTYLLIGSPPRPYFLDMDTGSDLTWIQCDAPCTSCSAGAHPLYKPVQGKLLSTTETMCVEVQKNQKVPCATCQLCDYEIEYADKSSTMGVLMKDELQLVVTNGSLAKFNIVFGCAYDQQGLLLNSLARTDGILGLSRAKVSLPSQLAGLGIVNNVLGHCLTTKAIGGGYMFLGDDYVPFWGMTWVPMLNTPNINLYYTEVMKISYGNGRLLDNTAGHVVFDSGSSYTYFTKQVYSSLIARLRDLSGELIQDESDSTLPLCWRPESPIRTIDEVKQYFKPLVLQFRNKWWFVPTKLIIPPEGYLIINNKGNVCLGILDGSQVYDGSTIILGDISLRGKLFIFDNENQKIGWTQSDCAYPQRFKGVSFF
ncbi:Xylanase inhibitor, N-terminal [Dillenia turbinata]|uniref:Xylanase inhibitor, N-terminal n=1 Tax=Dillenia turbinata TaxID=194707 RepID=A0AAN8UYB4_9MAGN